MKKQKIQFIVLAVLIIICIGGYFVIKNTQFEQEEESTEVVLTSIDAETVTSLTVTGSYNYSMEKSGEEWIETSIPDENIDESKIEDIINDLCSLTTVETVVEAPENLEEYGLAEPVLTATLTQEDGTQTVIYIGDRSELLAKYYSQVDGDDNVYLINYAIVSGMMKETEKFIAEEETETDAEIEETVSEEMEEETETSAS